VKEEYWGKSKQEKEKEIRTNFLKRKIIMLHAMFQCYMIQHYSHIVVVHRIRCKDQKFSLGGSN
jgi:hypothetical protein